MSLRSRVRTWWRAVTRGADVDAQVDEELRFHIESYAEDLMRGGMPREQAMRRAKAELGSLAAAKREVPAGVGHTVVRRAASRPPLCGADAGEESRLCGDCGWVACSRDRREHCDLFDCQTCVARPAQRAACQNNSGS